MAGAVMKDMVYDANDVFANQDVNVTL